MRERAQGRGATARPESTAVVNAPDTLSARRAENIRIARRRKIENDLRAGLRGCAAGGQVEPATDSLPPISACGFAAAGTTHCRVEGDHDVGQGKSTAWEAGDKGVVQRVEHAAAESIAAGATGASRTPCAPPRPPTLSSA
jgi:hypothetical protein